VLGVNSFEEFLEIINGDKLAVVAFTAEWCGPYRGVAHQFTAFAEECPTVVACEVDADRAPDAAEMAHVVKMPTLQKRRKGRGSVRSQCRRSEEEGQHTDGLTLYQIRLECRFPPATTGRDLLLHPSK
jgi:thiol-disulfide isomerase/thioredoxin